MMRWVPYTIELLGQGMRRGFFGWGLGALLLLGCEPPKPHVDYDPGTVEFYHQDVEPILRKNCASCHLGMNHKGDFSMKTPEGIMRGGKHGRAVVPGHC